MKKISGVTLVEIVITMMLSAILLSVVAYFINRPIVAYTQITKRAELIDAAELSLRRIARDIQQAVPNSIRIKQDPFNSNRTAIEFLNVVDGARYRSSPPGSYLSLTQTTTSFDILGEWKFALNNPTCAADNCRLVVYNTGANNGGVVPSDNPSNGLNVYSDQSVSNCAGCFPPPGSVTITPESTNVILSNNSGVGHVDLTSGVLFAFPSQTQRLYVVDTPVTYICDTSPNQQTLMRYDGYSITSIQPTDPAGSPLNAGIGAPLAKLVSSCQFSYSPGTAERNGIVTIGLTLKKGEEVVQLMRQISVVNAL